METLLDVPPGVLNQCHPYVLRDKLVAAGLTLVEAEELMSRVSWEAIKAQPRQFAWKATKRIGNFWRCVSDLPLGDVGDEPEYQDQRAWTIPRLSDAGEYLLGWTPTQSLWWCQVFSGVAWLAAVKLLLTPQHRWKGMVLLMTYSYFCILTGLVEIENYRYRMVLEPIMILGIVTAFVAPSSDEPVQRNTDRFGWMRSFWH
jgi:hypothetical protein